MNTKAAIRKKMVLKKKQNLLLKNIAGEHVYDRMVSMAQYNEFNNYTDFYNNSVNVINSLPKDELDWLLVLSKKIDCEEISVADGETCCRFDAECFYYSATGQLCIISAR